MVYGGVVGLFWLFWWNKRVMRYVVFGVLRWLCVCFEVVG